MTRRGLTASGAGLMVLLAFGAGVIGGCSHYSFAADDDPTRSVGSDSEEPLRVATVAAPAHWQLDAGRLTRSLVDALAARGRAARWAAGPNSSRPDLRCAVQLPPWEQFAGAQFVEATARCRLERTQPAHETDARRRASAQAGRQTPQQTLVVLAEDAAERALSAAARNIVRHLQEN